MMIELFMLNNLQFTDENYLTVREQTRKLYGSFGCVKCSALEGQSIFFTSEGFNHLLYKNKRERNKKDQFMRFKVLDLAKKILDITTTYQEYEEIIQKILVKVKKHKEYQSVLVKYWGFIAIIERKKLRVVVRQIRGGRTTKHGDIQFMDYTTRDLSLD